MSFYMHSEHIVQEKYVGRLAPSPTGLLHLGNIWSFLWAWLLAKRAGGSVLLRLEDLDPKRSRFEFSEAIIKDLQWLGLFWDGEICAQSTRQKFYENALQILNSQGYIYPCYCTRKDLRTLAGAPHVEDMGAPYNGHCAHLSRDACMKNEAMGRRAALRLRTQDSEGKSKEIFFEDTIYGKQYYTLHSVGGDFALRRSDKVIAYQLAVVLDDAAQSVTHIVRGRDILVSTPRQIYLQELLKLHKTNYAHVPLLLDENGERLAKRHNALSVHSLRHAGVSAERILGLCAYLSGYIDELKPCYLAELKEQFSLARCRYLLKANDIVLKNSQISFLYA